MVSNDKLIALLVTEQAGFTLIRSEAEKALKTLNPADCLRLAKELYASDVHQARMFAVLLLGTFAATEPMAFAMLEDKVIHDPDWRTQEMLARAFDQYCKDRGYEASMPVIKKWLAAPEPNQRRAVSEGLRVWASRPYLKEHPMVAITLLSALRADANEYVRKSVGNALRDISKKHPDLIRDELKTWDLTDHNINFTYKLAAKFIHP